MNTARRKTVRIVLPMAAVAIVALLYALVPNQTKSNANAKIPLRPDMIINVWTGGDGKMLIDEQEEAGDPRSGNGGTPSSTSWTTGWGTYYWHENEVILDLEGTYRISDLYVYGAGSGFGKVSLQYGEPFQWQHWIDYEDSSTTPRWLRLGTEEDEVIDTRYIRVTISEQQDTINFAKIFSEMVLYGTLLEAVPPVAEARLRPAADMKDFIGINAFIDDPLVLMKAAGTVREYHNWYWDEGNAGEYADPDYPGYPDNKNAWNPSYGYSGWNFDDYYKNLREAGVDVFPAIQGGVDWTPSKKQLVSEDADPANPASYAPYADHMFQYAARYGKTKVSPDLVKVREDNEPLTGLGYLDYIEGGNEIDCYWCERDEQYTPFEYAARVSASYDGHQGSMRKPDGLPGYGVKEADPHMKFVLPGLADADLRYSLDYIRSIKLWGDTFRDPEGPNGSFPGDVINLHFYAFGKTLDPGYSSGVSPELFGIKRRLAPFVEYRNRHLPDKEIWVSEFGYDINQGSPISAPPIVNSETGISYTAEEVQGMWLVRTFLELAAAGVDRAQMYMLRDVNLGDSTQFSSSGLVTSPDNGKLPRASWYYIYAFKETLAGLHFESEMPSDHPEVSIYRFADSNGETKALAVWSPTQRGALVKDFELQFPAGTKEALLVELQHGETRGVQSQLTVGNGGIVSIDVSERPQFIVLNLEQE